MTTPDRPLYERVILVTRPEERSQQLKRKLEALGARVEARPTIALEAPQDFGPPESALRKLGDYDWLLFTSINAVNFFFGRLFERGMDARAEPRGLPGCAERWDHRDVARLPL